MRDAIIARIEPVWVAVVRVGRVLWACRVSAVSAFLGLFLFQAVAPAQNLFADTSWNAHILDAIGYWGAVFAALFVVWAFPVHYGARWTLADNAWLVSPTLRKRLRDQPHGTEDLELLETGLREDHAWAIKWVPRALGVLPFAAFAIGIVHALATQWVSNGLGDAEETLVQLFVLLAVDVATAVGFIVFVIYRQPLIDYMSRKMPGWPQDKDPLETFVRLSLVATFAIFLLSYYFPLVSATLFPRALLIPFLLGSLVLILSWMQRRAHHDGIPYITIAVVGCLLVTGLNQHFNDLRTVSRTTSALAKRQIDLGAAVARWKKANDCETGRCPPALVIAIDGGASRAAFAAATFIGEILDRMPPARGHGRSDPARRIFAMSGVSGGSVGAVAIRTALVDAMNDPAGAPPCKNAYRTWFRAERFGQAEQPFTWRDCLQAIVTGDYLSPVFIGLGFRDNFAPSRYIFGGPSLLDDRAALLERAFERHYEAVIGHRGAAAATTEVGMRRRFGYLPLAYEKAADARSWLPVLLLNATSVQTGRRVVVSDLSSTYLNRTASPVGLYTQAYDFFEMTSAPCKTPDLEGGDCDPGNSPGPIRFDLDASDIVLSTAAVASARFPIISPAGAVTVTASPAYGDRLVDGGYFENSGDTTGLDLANALLELGLEPIILSISNEPEREVVAVSVPRRQVVTPVVGPSGNDLQARTLGIFYAPVQALLNTRDGHAAEAKDLVVRTFGECHATTCPASTFYKLGVAAAPDLSPDPDADPRDKQQCEDIWTDEKVDVAKIALSWWLSGSLQAEIDAQRCTKANRATLHDIMLRLGPG
jgi:hypothetical protein